MGDADIRIYVVKMRGTIKWLTISLMVSIIAIIIVLILTVTDETIGSLARIRPEYLILAFGVRVVTWLLWGIRIQVMTNVVGRKLSMLQSLKIVLCGVFAAGVTPSYVGGTPVRIYLLNREGMTIGDAALVDLVCRSLDGLVIGMAFPFAWFMFRDLIRPNIVLSSTFTILGVLFSIGFVLGLYAVTHQEKVEQHLERLSKSELMRRITFDRSESIASRIVLEMDNFRVGLFRCIKEEKKSLFVVILCSIAFWLLLFIMPSLVLLGLDADPIWIQSMSVQVILMVAVMLPIAPGGSGIAELGSASLYATVLPTENLQIIGIFVLVWRFVMYYTNLIVGGAVSLKVLQDIDLTSLSGD
ncbi:MAG: flippase-like domain-containing protein [Halobacteriota archaeon]|nr:flippase-like domain-containing protein [Halobacteriota archaeon]